ncbi:long-chain fatty acid--CoA ligase [Sesbania bispinosa]|nr:long-chain fatty acid--CoA ligase [Sesbania bispinosa]
MECGGRRGRMVVGDGEPAEILRQSRDAPWVGVFGLGQRWRKIKLWSRVRRTGAAVAVGRRLALEGRRTMLGMHLKDLKCTRFPPIEFWFQKNWISNFKFTAMMINSLVTRHTITNRGAEQQESGIPPIKSIRRHVLIYVTKLHASNIQSYKPRVDAEKPAQHAHILPSVIFHVMQPHYEEDDQ